MQNVNERNHQHDHFPYGYFISLLLHQQRIPAGTRLQHLHQ
jgi:hypothetical protein